MLGITVFLANIISDNKGRREQKAISSYEHKGKDLNYIFSAYTSSVTLHSFLTGTRFLTFISAISHCRSSFLENCKEEGKYKLLN